MVLVANLDYEVLKHLYHSCLQMSPVWAVEYEFSTFVK